MTADEWAYVRRHAWRFQGGPQWTRDMGPIRVFLAQSYAVGVPRIAGLALHLLGDFLFDKVSSPLLKRGMRGPHLGTDARPLSITKLAWWLSGVTNGWRWTLYRWGNGLARYNRPWPSSHASRTG